MKYRILRGYEIVKEGDEYKVPGRNEWVKCILSIGDEVANYALKFRRPVLDGYSEDNQPLLPGLKEKANE
jgi:hypothetical protein